MSCSGGNGRRCAVAGQLQLASECDAAIACRSGLSAGALDAVGFEHNFSSSALWPWMLGWCECVRCSLASHVLLQKQPHSTQADMR